MRTGEAGKELMQKGASELGGEGEQESVSGGTEHLYPPGPAVGKLQPCGQILSKTYFCTAQEPILYF